MRLIHETELRNSGQPAHFICTHSTWPRTTLLRCAHALSCFVTPLSNRRMAYTVGVPMISYCPNYADGHVSVDGCVV